MSFASNGAHWVAKSVELRITPFPVGGRCRLDVYWSDADQPCPSGIPYWRLRVVIPATGVDATRFANASSDRCSTLSICGLFWGTAWPNTRVSAAKIPDWLLSENEACMLSRNGLNRAVSLSTSP